MKCTDFYSAIKSIQRIEEKELKAALMAHGGKYDWMEYDCSCCPIVLIDSEYISGNCSITKAEIEEGGGGGQIKLTITIESGCNYSCGWEECVYASDVCVGHMQFITESIPATDKVNDVAIPNIYEELIKF